MSTLHIVNKAATQSPLLHSCLRLMRGGDSLLLIEDGVYAACHGQTDWMSGLPADVSCMVLSADVAARGLDARLDAAVQRIDDAGFVQACVAHQRSVSWF